MKPSLLSSIGYGGCWFVSPVLAFQWFCHHTYHALSPPLAGYGGCVDEQPSGLGGVEDQRLIYEFAQQAGFMTMGGGGHTHTCYDVLCLCASSTQRCAYALVLDNGHPGDVSVPVYATVMGVDVNSIGPNCEGANAALPIDTVTIVANVREHYREWVRFSKPFSVTSLSSLLASNCLSTTPPANNGTTSLSFSTSLQTLCYTIDSTGVWHTRYH
jgi:hypothetical protein